MENAIPRERPVMTIEATAGRTAEASAKTQFSGTFVVEIDSDAGWGEFGYRAILTGSQGNGHDFTFEGIGGTPAGAMQSAMSNIDPLAAQAVHELNSTRAAR